MKKVLSKSKKKDNKILYKQKSSKCGTVFTPHMKGGQKNKHLQESVS
jgi:hypothetical protein